MKRFSLVCCLVLLLNMFCPVAHVHAETITTPTDLPCEHAYVEKVSDETYHWGYCDSCDTIVEGKEQHYAVCNTIEGDTVLCGGCGETVAVANCALEHSYENVPMQYDETNHWQTCWCGEGTRWESPHELYCDDPDGGCFSCGYMGEIELIHVTSEDLEFGWNADTHWYSCICGEITYTEKHEVYCYDPDDPCWCGYTGEVSEMIHSGGTTFVYVDADNCGAACTVCGEVTDTLSHSSSGCQDTTCERCGGEFAGGYHNDADGYEYDENGHWFICTDCGEKANDEDHWYSCDDPTSCGTCGYKTTGAVKAIHWWTEEYTDCGDYHAKICPKCNAEAFALPHIASCTNPKVCMDCGATNVATAKLSHITSGYEYDETSCWQVCSICEEKCYEGPHRASCEEPGICMTCGLRSANIPVSTHNTINSKVYHDETNHWRICSLCGEKAYLGEHYEYCNDANGCCHECSYVGDVEVWHQALKNGWESDADSHWKTCAICSEPVDQEPHVDADNDGLCDVCGDTCTHTHTWGEPVVKEATCTSAGSKTVTCSVCGETETETIPATGHAYEWHSDAEGYHWEYCTKCHLMQNYEPHFTYCSEEDQNVCYLCAATVDDGSMELVHDYDGMPWEYDAGSHWQNCYCGEGNVDYWTHEVFCTDPEAECFCGYVGEVEWIQHNFNYNEATYIDADFHLVVCEDCGTEETYSHWSEDCLTDICLECGGTFDGNNHMWPEQYEYDEDGHWFICEMCNETVNDEAHWYTCTAPDTCELCGYKTTGATDFTHYWTTTYEKDNAYYHYKKCPECGEGYDFFAHIVSCAQPDVCLTCGATGVDMDNVSHGEIKWEHNDTKHWGVCTVCNETVGEGLHWTDCSQPDFCQDCGAKNVTIDPEILSHFDVEWGRYENDATHHWYTCRSCNVKAFYTEHYVSCTEKGICSACGIVGDFKVVHDVLKPGWEKDAANHWMVCAVCDEVTNKAAHVDKDNDGKCDVCEQSATHVHSWGDPVTVEATCAADGSKTTACTACGEKMVEVIPAHGQHTWKEVANVAATCTKQGRVEKVCTVCDETSIVNPVAKGHSYGLVFTTQGNGTHAKTCADCGAKHTEDCALTSTEVGSMTCSACAICGYTVYTMNDAALGNIEGVENADELADAKAETTVKRVENVSFELVPVAGEDEAETVLEPVDYSDVMLVVHETVVEMKVELPDAVNAEVKKVLAVSLLKEGTSIQPNSKVKLSIPVVEEEIFGLKLMLMTETGELIELEYEIIDGVLVFETEMVGIFLFVDTME